MRKCTESHEWIEIESNLATIGITSYAAADIGQIAFVELPKVGLLIEANSVSCIIESSKAAIEIRSPVSGTVVRVNDRLRDAPELIELYPESEGWLYTVEMKAYKEVELLMDYAEYKAKIHP